MPDPIKDPSQDPDGKGDQDGKGSGNGDPNVNPDVKPDDAPADQFVTPTILQNLLNAEKRRTADQFKEFATQNAATQASIEAFTKSLAERDAPKPGGSDDKGGQSKDPESAELIELRRTVDELKETNKASDARAADERQKRLDQDFKNTVIAALVDAGCEKADAAFLVIKPRLKHDSEDDKIFANVTTAYGDEDLDLKTYIERHFREEVLPHVFKGKMRTGAPAAGDAGGGGGFQFTKEQALDVEAYMKDPEKHRAAIEQGRVKGLKKVVS